MFAAINNSYHGSKLEQKQICSIYIYGLKNKKYNIFDGYTLRRSENKVVLDLVKMYLKFNQIKHQNFDTILLELKDEQLRTNRFLFLYCLQRCLDAGDYLRANKMLAYCEYKQWFCPRFYQLKAKYKADAKVTIN